MTSRFSIEKFSGTHRMTRYPIRTPTSASAMPVLPAVGSMIVPPFFRTPSRSARAIIPTPMRSLTDPPGLRNSSLAKIAASFGLGMLINWTMGVLPIRSRTLVTGGRREGGKGGDSNK